MAIGIIIGNLGTPRSPTTRDVKSYLKEFLMDPYVIDKPFWFRYLLVNGIIAPLRSHKSAHAYASIWRKEGSPLLSITESLTQKLAEKMGDKYRFAVAMRYGDPSIKQALAQLKDCDQILLFPQYPQYAESSYRTWMEEALKAAQELGIEDRVFAVPEFYSDPEYLEALEMNLKKSLSVPFDHLLFSFHGLPERHVKKVLPKENRCFQSSSCCDVMGKENCRCYRAQCYSVAREMAKRLGLSQEKYSVSFQSRLGRDPWIQPFTDKVLQELPLKGVKRLAVAMPAFTVDCLETLEEIHIRAQEDFLKAGGESLIPLYCLNEDEAWIQALCKMIDKSLAAPVKPCP